MRSRKLLALLFCLITFPAIAGYMTLLGAGVGSIAPVVSWVSTTDPTFPSSSLTYSGPSLSTMFDSTGKLIYKPNNLLTQSNTFNNAAWSSLNGGTGTAPTVTSGQSDPLGGTTAFRLQAARGASNTTGDYSFIYNSFASLTGANYAGGVWIKSNTGSSQTVSVWLNTGAAVSSTAFVTVTTSWQFLSPSVLNATGSSNLLAIGTRGGTYGGQATVDVLVYAAVASAVTYETSPRTADQVITTSSAYYGPRIDYDPNTLAVKGLLIEEARTNLTTRSGELTNASWGISGLNRGTDATLDLTGATAVKLTATATLTIHNIYNGPSVSVTSGSTYTQSWFVKAGTHSKVLVNAGDGTNYSAAVFDISGTADGTATQIGQNADTAGVGKSKYLGNGWFRVSLTFTAGANGTRYTVVAFAGALTGNVFNGYGDNVCTTTGTETIYIGQPQFELGSFATSYIPTAAASVTRAADVVQFTGAALTALQGGAGSAIVETSDAANSGSSQALIGSNAVNNMYMRYVGTAVSSLASDSTTLTASGTVSLTSASRSAVAWGASSRSLVHDGGTVATDAKTFSGASAAYLGAANGGAQYWINGHVASFAIYNQRLPDATLQAKSVVGASYAANDNGLRFADNDNLPIHWRVAL